MRTDSEPSTSRTCRVLVQATVPEHSSVTYASHFPSGESATIPEEKGNPAMVETLPSKVSWRTSWRSVGGDAARRATITRAARPTAMAATVSATPRHHPGARSADVDDAALVRAAGTAAPGETSSARSTSSARCGRSAGRFSSSRITRAASAGGVAGRRCAIGAGV
jgi:hypothetical protein